MEARARIAHSNEELVLAEAALHGERMVVWIRFALIVFMNVSQGLVRSLSGLPMDSISGLVNLAYILFAIAIWALLRGAVPNPLLSKIVPSLVSVVDFAFPVIMATRAAELGPQTHLEVTVAHCALLLTFSIVRMGLMQVVISTVMACGVFVFIAVWLNLFTATFGSFVLGIYVTLGLLIGHTSRRVHKMFVDLRRRDNLSRFLPRQLVDRVMQMDEALEPTQRVVTVLFSDIRDFTALSENRPPREILEFLDEYFSNMSQIVNAHDGIVNKFIGDGMLAFWGVPNELPNHAELSTRAALEMRTKLEEMNGRWQREGKKPVRVGIGIHTGVVAAGMLGGADQHEYSVIGDAVNLASRVEGLTKNHGVDILITEDTFRAIGEGFSCRRVGEEQVKGREKPVVVYALLGLTSR
ncbi:MAG: adenylate/guanylate cyclase domain-containing protein [Candidatus Riflebacteria bacterium]|nr:adenylate/guanylate cyclase domain-containing protein [Candidatus Riflebacteria bacterium]